MHPLRFLPLSLPLLLSLALTACSTPPAGPHRFTDQDLAQLKFLEGRWQGKRSMARRSSRSTTLPGRGSSVPAATPTRRSPRW